MKNGMSTYDERIKNPGVEIIDFSYLDTHPESIYIVYERYSLDFTFRQEINTKMQFDPNFKMKFGRVFGKYLERNNGDFNNYKRR